MKDPVQSWPVSLPAVGVMPCRLWLVSADKVMKLFFDCGGRKQTRASQVHAMPAKRQHSGNLERSSFTWISFLWTTLTLYRSRIWNHKQFLKSSKSMGEVRYRGEYSRIPLGSSRLARFSLLLSTKAKMGRELLSKLLNSGLVSLQLHFFGAFFLIAYSSMVYYQQSLVSRWSHQYVACESTKPSQQPSLFYTFKANNFYNAFICLTYLHKIMNLFFLWFISTEAAPKS